MENLSNLAQRVLSMLEKDSSKWSDWTKSYDLYPVSQSSCIQTFVSCMKQAKSNQEKVFVAGDYDCDGIMATSIMVLALRKFGLEVGFYIPDRIKEGYGLHASTVELVHQKGYQWIVTVDNGVKAYDALSCAKELGLQVIVTDHHILEKELDDFLVVHPDFMEPEFKTLCGAAIAYECSRALGVDCDYFLEMAGVASVGDMMQVTGQTRAIIQNALKALNKNRERHICLLCNDSKLDETSIGFQIVPKLNAIGRLSNLANVNNVVRYFLSEDVTEITHLGVQINQINDRRKKMSEQMCKDARNKCISSSKIFVINDDSFHEGIIGLVAGSLCASYQKPVIVLTNNQMGYKASMRSPEGFDCMEFLKDFDSFSEFGGHVNAAGFSLNFQEYDAFTKYVKQRIQTFKWSIQKKETLPVTLDDLSLSSIESLDVLRPFGTGFVCPDFELNDVQIKSIFDIQNGKHRKFTLNNGLQCMNFNQSMDDYHKSVNSIQGFIGHAQINQYRGKKQVTFIIDSIKYK